MTIKRVFVGGMKNFTRGGAVSAATVLIMTVTLSIIGSLIFVSALLSYTLTIMKGKLDVSAYFVTTATESQILSVKDQLEKLPQVAEVSYVSSDDALTAFRARHANDQITLQALDLLGFNPLDASLEIKAKDPSQYESIVKFIEASPALTENGTSIVDGTNYKQNKEVLDRLTLAIDATRSVGLAVVLVFAIASMLIAFATIRLAIYTARDEIAVMRLVGASNAYIRGPFIVAGVISGLIAAFIVLLLFWPAAWYVGARTITWFGGFSVSAYYASHFLLIFVILVGSGVLLGALASVLAIRKYLNV